MESIEGNVMCPFYKRVYAGRDRKLIIKCEGAFESAMATQSVFRSYKNGYEHLNDFCCGNYHACPIEQMLDANYK